ncbi:MAG: tetratricopeptide repeat protein [Labilithrix sp.]|nr:tetratricopeptide repeat protein [Labilithrix sp.]
MSFRSWVRGPGILMALVCAAGAFGCAAPQSKMRKDVEAMKAESTPEHLVASGDAYASVGDMTRAEQYFVAALRSGGEHDKLVRRLIAVCVSDSRYPVALDYADEYLRKHPADVDVRYAAATLRVAVGDDKRAREELARVFAARPDHAEGHYLLALVEKGGGDVMAADAQFRAYLTAAPDGEHAEVARANLMRSVP